MYIVTQLIKINVTRRTQDMREPPARAHLWNQWLIKWRVHRFYVDYDFGMKDKTLKDKIKKFATLRLLQ